ncbi:cytochrome c [Geotalea uraniireducens]|uniref:Cytochrome c n=1 Tax=Geotalea uraniireducens TaxID=351604 RepID=A0ABN6VTV1_9BACT|nr:cytochrome C [Geotalea uraniireducens]BDV43774.1 cytochrome c [Geotalea uraniireducens]
MPAPARSLSRLCAALLLLLAATAFTSRPAGALTMTAELCTRCHTGDNPDRHHALIQSAGKLCLDCHQLVSAPDGSYTVPLVRDCVVCHSAQQHSTVQHTVEAPRGCARCHSGTLIQIHTGDGYSGKDPLITNEIYPCLRCHTSTLPVVVASVSAGLSGQTITCWNCHPDGMAGGGGTVAPSLSNKK